MKLKYENIYKQKFLCKNFWFIVLIACIRFFQNVEFGVGKIYELKYPTASET